MKSILIDKKFIKYGKKLKRLAANNQWHKAAINYLRRYIFNVKLDVSGLQVIHKSIEDDFLWFKNNNLTKVWKKARILFSKIVQDVISEFSEYYNLPSDSDEYRRMAKFKITGNNLIHIKGYEKLLTLGKYHPVNNPNGVVKDHMISINFGKVNGISPKIIGHIMNCEYLTFKENALKNKDCSISVSELLCRIKKYNRH